MNHYIRRYSLLIARLLFEMSADCIIISCGTVIAGCFNFSRVMFSYGASLLYLINLVLLLFEIVKGITNVESKDEPQNYVSIDENNEEGKHILEMM